jgi:hypothetical protein
MIGGTLGAIVGALTLTGAVGLTAATGGLAAPFVAGPVAAALASAGAGAAAGSVIGALVGAGVPPEQRDRLEHGIKEGGIVVAVDAKDDDVETVRRILEQDERSFGSAGTSRNDDAGVLVDAGSPGGDATRPGAALEAPRTTI